MCHKQAASRISKSQSEQGLLFPESGFQLCEKIGLNHWAAAKLHEDGWLSFLPETTSELSQNQEYELRFIGALVAGGCGPALLPELLKDLDKPYCYNNGQIYYDWAAKAWQSIPDPRDEIETLVEEWIEELQESGDVGQLEQIKTKVDDALSALEDED
tara:strand:+ start:2474 stop:2947 length:474 start_codon:yes stop_codon:yes gene_type:complete